MHLPYETCIGYEYWSDEYWLWHPFRIKKKMTENITCIRQDKKYTKAFI